MVALQGIWYCKHYLFNVICDIVITTIHNINILYTV